MFINFHYTIFYMPNPVGFYTDEEGRVRPITPARGRFRVRFTSGHLPTSTLTKEEFEKLKKMLDDYSEIAYQQTYENYLADAEEDEDYVYEEAEEAAKEAASEVGEIVEKLKDGTKLTNREKNIIKHVLTISSGDVNREFVESVCQKLKLGKPSDIFEKAARKASKPPRLTSQQLDKMIEFLNTYAPLINEKRKDPNKSLADPAVVIEKLKKGEQLNSDEHSTAVFAVWRAWDDKKISPQFANQMFRKLSRM